jgi:hypothetical protein
MATSFRLCTGWDGTGVSLAALLFGARRLAGPALVTAGVAGVALG